MPALFFFSTVASNADFLASPGSTMYFFLRLCCLLPLFLLSFTCTKSA